MPYDPTRMADWQISESAEKDMKSIWQLQREIGLEKDEVIPSGRVGRLDFAKILERLKDKEDGKCHKRNIANSLTKCGNDSHCNQANQH